ncbi:unnamed protein product [Prunus brigantina]
MKSKLASLNEKLDVLERKLELLEVQVVFYFLLNTYALDAFSRMEENRARESDGVGIS